MCVCYAFHPEEEDSEHRVHGTVSQNIKAKNKQTKKETRRLRRE